MTRRQKIWDCIFPVAFILICMAASAVTVMLIAGLVTHIYEPEEIYTRVHSVPMWTSVLFYSLTIVLQRKNFGMDAMRFGQERNLWTAGRNVLAVLVVATGGHVVSTLIGISGMSNLFTGYTENAAPAFQGQNPVLLIVATVILGPIAEEITFRGMTYRRIRYYLGSVPAMLLSSALFGLYHGNVIQFVYAFIVGLLLAWIYEKSASLRLCVAAHMAVNLWAILADLLSRYISGAAAVGIVAAEAVAAVAGLIVLRTQKGVKK